MKVDKILVAYDFSKTACHALEQGCALAETFSAELHVLYALDTVFPGYIHSHQIVAAAGRNLETKVIAEMKRIIAPKKLEALKWKTDVQEGRAYHVICDYAQEVKVDLIIMGTHGHRGLERILLGSVAEKVLRHAPCSVLIHRHTSTKGFKNLLLGVEMDELSEKNMVRAASIAKTFSAKLEICHVIHPPSYIPVSDFGLGFDFPVVQSELIEEDLKKFKDFMGKTEKKISLLKEIECHHRALEGNPVEKILDLAEKNHHDLLVMGSKKGSLARTLLGSVTEGVTRYAHCSVLVLRPGR